MFVYLSKKIAIPNGVKIRSIAWNQEQGWIACGGENGLLKVLKLDNGQPNSNAKGGSNLSMNQTLEGHEKALSVVAWNDQYRKLTSSDESGLIIVWTLHRGMWFEEMINNRNRSVVRDLSWNNDGQKVCIVYEDGAVIVGGVDGNRLWGKEMKKNLAKVTWSPDGRFLLFGTTTGEVHVHDSVGGQSLSKVTIMCFDEGEHKLAGLTWHPAFAESPEPAAGLAICYENGKMQLMRSDSDEKPYLIDTGLLVTSIRWNPQGTILAVAGVPLVQGNVDRSVVVAQFFSNAGVHLRTLRVPGSMCGGICWEGNGLRIALAVDSFMYFANVRPDYKFAYFSKTAVYTFQRPEKVETSVMFWHVKSLEKTIKQVRHLTHLTAAGDACLIVSRQDDIQQYMVQLVNSIGGPMETRYTDLEPLFCAMNESHVVCCGEEGIYVWQYRNPLVSVDALDPIAMQMQAGRRDAKDRIIHIDELVSEDSLPTMTTKKALTNDLICCVCVSSQYAFVGRESGLLQIYQLSPLRLVGKMMLASRAQSLSVNCNSTTLSVIDLSGVMTLVTIAPDQFSVIARPATTLNFERKDVWNMMWASDNPEMFAIMEKTRMYIFRGLEPEEPVQSSAHICKFKSLRVRAINLDDTIQPEPEKPNKDVIVDYETKSLRDTREILASVSIKDAFQYVEDHPHPKLWSLLAEHSLGQLDFAHAEKAVVRCKEYPAIQFVKRVKALDDPAKQRAEVHAYYHRFDEAEKIYKEMDRKDLALELRARLGDWFRVVQLVHEGGGDESILFRAWENIGDFYADRQKWSKAAMYYTQCKNYRKLAQIYYVMEDFKNLEKMVETVGTHDKEILMTIGGMLISVGLADSAVRAYLAAGETRKAVDCCVELNQWDHAVALAEKHKLADIEQVLSKYATHLVDKDRIPQAIELYRKAGQNGNAAKLLSKLAQNVAQQSEPLKAKKFYVLSALEVEKFRKKQLALRAKTASQVVDDLLSADQATASDRSLDAAWRGAEAYHFFLMCQTHLLNGNFDVALIVAMRLMEFDDLIKPAESYSLIALSSYLARNYGLCSKAFTRLEGLEMEDQFDSNGIAGGQLNLIDFTNELDVTKRTKNNAATTMVATMAPATAAVTMGPGLGAATMAGGIPTAPVGGVTRSGQMYTTVNINEPPRRFGDLAVKLFSAHQPVDTSVDRVKCVKCGSFNADWASGCARCQHPFSVCMVTGKAITEQAYWQCNACHHRALDNEVGKYRNCPLCHTPRR